MLPSSSSLTVSSSSLPPYRLTMSIADMIMPGVEFVALRDALDGDDVAAAGLPRQHRAGFDRPAIDMHDTGAALAGIAADMGAGQVQMVAQEIDKEGPVLDLGRDRLAVHRQFDCRHVETSMLFNCSN